MIDKIKKVLENGYGTRDNFDKGCQAINDIYDCTDAFDFDIKDIAKIVFDGKSLDDVVYIDEDDIEDYQEFCQRNSYYEDEPHEIGMLSDFLVNLPTIDIFEKGLQLDYSDYRVADYFTDGTYGFTFFTEDELISEINDNIDFKVSYCEDKYDGLMDTIAEVRKKYDL